MHQRLQWSVCAALALLLALTSCGDDADITSIDTSSDCFSAPAEPAIPAPSLADLSGTTVTLATHDSFALSPETLEAFTAETGIEVIQVAGGDAGQLVSTAVLTRDNPTADVLFGIDNTFLCGALEEGVFDQYVSANLGGVNQDLVLDPHNRVTPIDYGDVCVNYWIDQTPIEPKTMDDLLAPELAGEFVTMDPETSSPGFAFLLATIAKYGEDGWEDYWTDLAANDLSITSGWSDAYYGEFVGAGGDRSVVTSYASSPPFEVLYSDPRVETPPTGVLIDSCYRQIEFAGILSGAANPAGGAALIDFMLTRTFQDDIPLNMFVYPSVTDAFLPPELVDHTPAVDSPLGIDPSVVEANREAWTARWREIVLR